MAASSNQITEAKRLKRTDQVVNGPASSIREHVDGVRPSDNGRTLNRDQTQM